MSLSNSIVEDLKKAMKEKDEVGKRTLRLLKSELGKKEVELGRDLTDEDELAVLTTAVKTRKDSISEYEKAGREDLATAEREELEFISRYMPAQLSDDEARAAIAGLASELGITERKQMGQLMTAVMAKYRGQVDGKLASRLAGEILS